MRFLIVWMRVLICLDAFPFFEMRHLVFRCVSLCVRCVSYLFLDAFPDCLDASYEKKNLLISVRSFYLLERMCCCVRRACRPFTLREVELRQVLVMGAYVLNAIKCSESPAGIPWCASSLSWPLSHTVLVSSNLLYEMSQR